MLGLEIGMYFYGISRNTKYNGFCPFKFAVVVPEILAFLGTTGSIVFGVKINYQGLTLEVVETDFLVAGSGGLKVRDFLPTTISDI